MAETVADGMRTLVIGLGNPILSDDGVGIHVARKLREMSMPSIDVEELAASGLELLDMIIGYDQVIVVDAIKTEGGRPGEFYALREEDFENTVHGASPHGINVATAFALGRKVVPDKMPKEVIFIAIEADDLVNVSEELTDTVSKALPSIVKFVVETANGLATRSTEA
ncbi:MAG: hydrogenase maturation protease [Methanomassiliicoccus sp.]|nr:MAG: hydrogenase maturation protease [Methanomassiliicoccus sp.]